MSIKVASPVASSDAGMDHIRTLIDEEQLMKQLDQILELRDISLNGRYILPDQRYRLIQLRLPPPGDENLGPFLYEAPGRSQADPAIASSDYCYLAFKRTHRFSPLTNLDPHCSGTITTDVEGGASDSRFWTLS